MQAEARLQRRIVRALEARGYLARRLRPLGLAGWPDIYALKGGRAYHLEVKMPRGRATPLQVHTLDALARAGAVVAVVDSVEAALEAVGSE